MKKALIGIVVIVAIVVIGLGFNGTLDTQPAAVTKVAPTTNVTPVTKSTGVQVSTSTAVESGRRKDDRPYCTVNGNTATYGYQYWKPRFLIFGSWQNLPGISVETSSPGQAQAICNNFLYGTPNQP